MSRRRSGPLPRARSGATGVRWLRPWCGRARLKEAMSAVSTRRRWASLRHQQVVQALLPHRADPPLGDRVRIGRAVGRPHDRHARAVEHPVDGRREFGVPITDEKTSGQLPVLQAPPELAGLLGDPARGRMVRTPGEMDSPGPDLDEEEDVHRLEQKRLHAEAVTRQELVLMALQEAPPGDARWATMGRGGTRWRLRTSRTVERPTR